MVKKFFLKKQQQTTIRRIFANPVTFMANLLMKMNLRFKSFTAVTTVRQLGVAPLENYLYLE